MSLARSFAVVSFSDLNRKKDGAVREKEIKNCIGNTNNVSERRSRTKKKDGIFNNFKSLVILFAILLILLGLKRLRLFPALQ